MGFHKVDNDRMGFATRWIEIIMKCITTVSYSVVMNRQLGVKFQSHRGLGLGDPLSHFLFLLCGEGLSSLMRLATREGLLKRVRLVGMVCRFHICYLQMILSYLGKQQEEGHSYSKTFYKNIDFSRVNV